MWFLAVQKDTPMSAAETVAPSKSFTARQKSAKQTGKWPLIWTVIGVTAICSTFWVTLFRFLF